MMRREPELILPHENEETSKFPLDLGIGDPDDRVGPVKIVGIGDPAGHGSQRNFGFLGGKIGRMLVDLVRWDQEQ